MGNKCEVCAAAEAGLRHIWHTHGDMAHFCEECWKDYRAMFGTPPSANAPTTRQEGHQRVRVRKGILGDG